MISKTKTDLHKNQINHICDVVFSKPLQAYSYVEKGFYNTIYKIQVNNQYYALKVAPSDDVEILTYEEDIIKQEVANYTLLKQEKIPVPTIIYHDFTKSIIPNDYYIMEWLPGTTLFDIWSDELDKTPYYLKIVKYLAIINNNTSHQFGYATKSYQTNNYYDVFQRMMEDVVHDGTKKHVVYPIDINEMFQTVKSYKDILESVKVPQLLHFDLWDGNVHIHQEEINGLLDLERSFYGPGIAEFAAMHINPFEEENQSYILEYNKYSIYPLQINSRSEILYYLHKLYLFLIMVVEVSYRDVEGSFDFQINWASEELVKILKILRFDLTIKP